MPSHCLQSFEWRVLSGLRVVTLDFGIWSSDTKVILQKIGQDEYFSLCKPIFIFRTLCKPSPICPYRYSNLRDVLFRKRRSVFERYRKIPRTRKKILHAEIRVRNTAFNTSTAESIVDENFFHQKTFYAIFGILIIYLILTIFYFVRKPKKWVCFISIQSFKFDYLFFWFFAWPS